MKAYAITQKGKIDAIELPSPELKPHEVLLELHYIGLCGSDLSTFRGQNALVSYPRVPGHEVSGKVVEKGAQVPNSIQIGDLAMVSPYTHCGVCPACKAGRFNTCENNQTLGVQREGAMTTHIAVPYEKVFSSKTLSLEELVLVEPLSVGYHAANRARVSEEDTVMVLGCGAIGLGAICASLRKGATVVAVDIDDKKLDIARKLGAQHLINSSEQSVVEVVKQLTSNEGVQVSIEAAGSETTQRMALECAAFAGRVAMIGYAKGESLIDTRLIVKKELDWVGSRNALRVFPNVIKMLEQRDKPYAELVSKVYPFAEVPTAFADWDANPNLFTKILIQLAE